MLMKVHLWYPEMSPRETDKREIGCWTFTWIPEWLRLGPIASRYLEDLAMVSVDSATVKSNVNNSRDRLEPCGMPVQRVDSGKLLIHSY